MATLSEQKPDLTTLLKRKEQVKRIKKKKKEHTREVSNLHNLRRWSGEIDSTHLFP